MEEAYRYPVASGLSRDKISELAEVARKECGLTCNVRLRDVIRSRGGKISYMSYLEDNSHTLFVEPDSHFHIKVSAHTGLVRDTFTFGHELGHFFLHWPLIRKQFPGQGMRSPTAMRDKDGNVPLYDLEANWFALAFLMPAEEFRAAYAEGVASVKFLVSAVIVEQRAKSLGLAA